MKIRVLHIIQGKHFGGAEQVVLTLAKSFNRDRVEAHVVCLSEGVLFEKLTGTEIPSYLVRMDYRADIVFPVLKIIDIVKKHSVDIIHTHTVRSNLVGRLAALLSRRKCVTHLHSPILRDFADAKRCRINERVDSMTRSIASCYIAVSHSLREEMIRKKKVPPDKIVTVHNGVDLAPMQATAKPEKKNGIREEYNISANAKVLVLIALLRPRKGIEVAVNAMKIIAEHVPEVFLLVVGNDDISEDRDYGSRVRRLATENGNGAHIIFTGFRHDVPGILRQSSMLVLPSLFGEGFPVTILEAMAMGIPVVASKVEGVPEVIEDGVNGFLCRPGDAQALANRVICALDDPGLLKRVCEKAQRRVLQELNAKKQAEQVAEVYKEVLAC